MKKLICFLSLSLVLASCSSDDDATTEEASSVLLTKTIETDGIESLTTVFTYEGNKIKETTDSDGYRMAYTYAGDLITKATEYDEDGNVFGVDIYTYNTQGQMVQNIYDAEGYKSKYDYTHNADGSISVKKYVTTLNSSVYVFSNDAKIYDTKIEISYPASEGSPAASDVYTCTYDDKNNPLVNVTGYSKLAFVGDRSTKNYANNLTSEAYRTVSGTTEVFSNTIYTYTAANFPATSVETRTTGGRPSSIQYFYN